MCFSSSIIFERRELEPKFPRHRVPLVETHGNMCGLTLKGQDQNLISGHVSKLGSVGQVGSKLVKSHIIRFGSIHISVQVKIIIHSYHSIRINEPNTIRPRKYASISHFCKKS